MRRLILILLLISFVTLPVSALEIVAPEVPESGKEFMPEQATMFSDGFIQLMKKAVSTMQPDLADAAKTGISLITICMLLSILQTFQDSVKSVSCVVGAAAISSMLLLNTNSLIRLGADTVKEISEYGKLLLPVLTTAMAANGGMTASAALYAGTALFNSFLSSLISKLFVPFVYLFLALAAACCAIKENMLIKMKAFLKWIIGWGLKIILIIFTSYISITGVVSGTTDAAALKATKLTISSFVPVVGSILSDASEAVLVSARMVKNAAGTYGILAILAVFLHPFIKISAHYLILKLTASVCSIFGPKSTSDLIEDFSIAMGLLLAMTGSSCLLLLIGTVCFMKGVA